MRKLIIVVIITLFILTSCNYDESSNFEGVTPSYGMSLKSSIDKYSLAMSSVPGFPFDITCNSYSEVEVMLIVKCEGGSLLLWHEDGTI